MPFDAQTVVLVLMVGIAAGWLGGLGDRSGGHVVASLAGAALATLLAIAADVRLPAADVMIQKLIIAALGAGVGVLVSRFVLR
jgi:hypothetical protein